MNWYIAVLKKYAVFNGRAHRTEYWMFVLFNVLIVIGLSIVSAILGIGGAGKGGSPLVSLYQLATLLPSIAAGVRRMHDTGRNGWWLLVPIANLIFLIEEGKTGDNEFGPDPKTASDPA